MNDNSSQLTVSYELLCLLRWLAEQEPEAITAIIEQSLDRGLREDIQSVAKSVEAQVPNDMQNSIVDFLGLLENLLQNALHSNADRQEVENKLLSAIDHIDLNDYDDQTLQHSIENTTVRLENSPKADVEKVLYKEILKCWKPEKTTGSN